MLSSESTQNTDSQNQEAAESTKNNERQNQEASEPASEPVSQEASEPASQEARSTDNSEPEANAVEIEEILKKCHHTVCEDAPAGV